MRIAGAVAATLLLCSSAAEAGQKQREDNPIEALGRRIPPGFTHVVERPFVVIGDESPAMVRRRARRTVRWAVRQLKAAYFPRDPECCLQVWLFKNERSYRKHALELFGDRPDTPYGYYSSQHRALIMNIGTGGGTLVHEIVHPFVEANFPTAPPWLNEGLGSLYEHSGQRDGKIVGLLNWRLDGLQEALRAGPIPSFRTLMAQDEEGFYGRDPGTNYAQARYLLYYLQEEGLLRQYYHAFRKNRRVDPTGYRTLARILRARDMNDFERRWERWVLTLRR